MIEVNIKTTDKALIEQLLQFIKQIGLENVAISTENSTQIEVVNTTDQGQMNEDKFWKIITLLNWKKAGDDEAVIAPVIEQLSQLSQTAILSFYDLLAEKLYLLDGEQYADASVVEGEIFSADLFLYARCAVVANGKAVFHEILNNSTLFPKDLYFDALLQIPKRAWFRKTGKELQHVPKFIYETGFNPSGWGKQTITL